MTVYVVHTMDNPSLRDNISQSRKFGELRYINRYYIHGDELDRERIDIPGSDDGESVQYRDVNIIPRGYLANMERCSADFNPGADYLLIAGDHLQLLALTAILINKSGFLDVLRWDRQLGEYIPVRLHSGLVPPRRSVLMSGTDIGDTLGQELENSRPGEVRFVPATSIEAPLVRRDPRKRPS